MSPDMAKTYSIQLDDIDLGQLLDGLESKAEAWEKTSDYLRTGESPEGEFFVIEECSDPEEADAVAGHYRSIISKISGQMEEQP